MIDAKALSLSELVQGADRIFVGTVEAVEAATVDLSEAGHSTKASIRVVTVRIDRALKGALTVGQRLEVRQLTALSAPLNAGEQVMWFLPSDSPIGLTQPLGIYSGDFRIDATDPARLAVNLRQNEGLWRDSLWTNDGFERGRVLREAVQALRLPGRARARIESAATRDPAPAGVPLDLLVSATLSQVNR